MSLFDDQLADFREPPAPFSGRNSLTDCKKTTSDVPLVIVDLGGQIACFILVHC